MTGYTFRVLGTPAPKGSTKSFPSASTGRVVTVSDCASLAQWEADVFSAAMRIPGRRIITGPVVISATFYLRRPKRASVGRRPEPDVKPDLSKLLRGIEDPLSGLLYDDDAQIVSATANKVYCAGDERPGALITVSPFRGGR